MSYRNEGEGEGTGRAPTSGEPQSQAHPHAPKGSRNGGQFVRKGSGGGRTSAGKGRRTRRTVTTKAAGHSTSGATAPARNGPMRTGDSGPDVADLNNVLSRLGLGHLAGDHYDADTEQAIRDVQRRLGVKETGHASAALLRKLHTAAALSPCIKRSTPPSAPTHSLTRGGAVVTDALTRSAMSTQDINDLPDDAFAFIEDGGSKDDSGKTVPRSLRHFPIHDPEHVRAALARMSQSPYGERAAKKIHKAAKRMGIGEYGSADDSGMDRATTPAGPEILRYDRLWALDDIEIQRGGDGRTVEAYAAVFNSPTEIKDQHGHYMEVIDRSAFNRAISHGIDRIGVFYHHGMTLAGTPSDLGSVPIGSPVDVRADGRGLRTVSRFNRSALADATLEAIRNGDIKGYSFRGRIFQSTPTRVARTRPGGDLPTVTRTELGLTEYGPTPSPYYVDAGIIAVRSADALTRDLLALDPDTRQQVLHVFATSSDNDNATPDPGPGAEDPPAEALRSATTASVRRKIALAQILGGIK